MDAVLLSRIQFGLTAGFHFIFPPLTIGLTLIILIFETGYLLKDSELYKNISTFLIRVLGLIFVIGVATGIVLEFSFGTNWSEYSRMVGDIFGSPLAAEGIFAFFLESVFLGILLFGRNRVSRRVYWLSAFLVFFASHLSGLWIIIANSWMQTPAGFEITGGRAVLTDFIEAAINHSTVERYTHTITASWLTGSIAASAIGAWYLLKNRNHEFSRALLKVSLTVFAVISLMQFVTGHAHSVQVAKTQPEKMAAFEALWESRSGAPLAVFGIPDEKNRTTHLEVGIPGLLSYLVYFDSEATIKGLNEFPVQDQPPVLIPYITYHVMIGLGSLFLLIGIVSVLLMLTGRLYGNKPFLTGIILASPLPVIANETGWMAAEIGRQPWAVFHVLRTADAASVVVPAWQVMLTLVIFTIIYMVLLAVFLKLLFRIIREGPENINKEHAGY